MTEVPIHTLVISLMQSMSPLSPRDCSMNILIAYSEKASTTGGIFTFFDHYHTPF